jgi:hypothetical protein
MDTEMKFESELGTVSDFAPGVMFYRKPPEGAPAGTLPNILVGVRDVPGGRIVTWIDPRMGVIQEQGFRHLTTRANIWKYIGDE